MKIGELAKHTGFNASAIRYYERLGLLAAPHRTGGQRRYPDEAVYRVLLIRFASNMGFALDEIKVFLGGLRDNAPVGPRWKKLAHRKIKAVEQTIKRSKQLKSLLQHLLQCHCASLQVCVERLSLSPGAEANRRASRLAGVAIDGVSAVRWQEPRSRKRRGPEKRQLGLPHSKRKSGVSCLRRLRS